MVMNYFLTRKPEKKAISLYLFYFRKRKKILKHCRLFSSIITKVFLLRVVRLQVHEDIHINQPKTE